MRGIVLVIVQFFLAILAVGLVLPAALLAFPSTHNATTGTAVAAALLLIIFVLVRAAWPRPKAD
jgi:hypothetical protein